MANQAYASVWCRGFGEETMPPLFEKLLETVPFSKSWPGFSWLVIRAVDAMEAPLEERDLRAFPPTADELVEMARDHLHADCAYEVQANWDLWTYDLSLGRWKQGPERLEVICNGTEYDGGICGEAGHFLLELGMEHLFTGHGNLLGARSAAAAAAPQHPTEAEFLSRMAEPKRLREYHEKTRENIAALFDWMRKIETALPVERFRLWSEGEDNFEARLDEILALR
ncbi:MAG: hypothetical protein HY234_10345 [Acidobacteria bacterium]|nr:hypothetical protein [Acidobacteriota bacterium]